MQECIHSFDLIIIGGRATGFAAAIKANGLGAKTPMISALWHTQPNSAFRGLFYPKTVRRYFALAN